LKKSDSCPPISGVSVESTGLKIWALSASRKSGATAHPAEGATRVPGSMEPFVMWTRPSGSVVSVGYQRPVTSMTGLPFFVA
jgi:hypothetical protein